MPKTRQTDIIVHGDKVAFANGGEVSQKFLDSHIFLGFIKQKLKEIAHWRFDSRTLDRSKYSPHQGPRECARRLTQCQS